MLFLKLLLALAICFHLPVIAFAHPGKTDSQGGHTDHYTGDYHYHHGYPAHEHYDMNGDGIVDCPYRFDDKTGSSAGGNDSSSAKPSFDDVPSATISKTFWDHIGGALLHLWDILLFCMKLLFAWAGLMVVCEIIGRVFKKKK